jgi:predicted RNase H-like HicB family nuclease
MKKERTLNYKIEYAFDKETGKVTATIPELNHVSSYGDNFEEAEKNIREAALCYLEALEKDKKPVPKGSASIEGTFFRLLLHQKEGVST